MDDRIQELLERARETAATAGEYAGQMVDTARLRGRLFALRTDINGLLHTAGRLVYDAHRGGAGGEDALEQVFSELDHKEAAAAELRSRLERLRQGEAALAAGRRDPDGSRFFAAFSERGREVALFHCFFGGRGVKYHVILAAAVLAANRQTVFRARPGRLLQIRRTSFMNYTFAQYQESADYIRSQIGGFAPKVAMILGSGLGYMGDIVENPIAVPYQNIPHFKVSTAPGHKGQLVFGTLEGQKVAVMQGRMHHYEGYSYEEVSYAVRVLRLLGCDTLIVTNAAGCVNLDWKAGDLMLIADHIKFFMESPLRGENLPEFGVRFPDASHLYTPALREMARQTARELGIGLREGVYMYFPGPQYETPAEVRAARVLGADAAGMSTAPEVITAGHCGMRVLGFTLLSNMGAGILDQPLSEQEVLDAAAACRDKFSRLVLACLKKID